MTEILDQLGLNATFFHQFLIFCAVFAALRALYFLPFQKLFHARRERTVDARTRADELMKEADRKLQEYQAKLHQIRREMEAEREGVLTEAKKEETKALSAARDEAKRITMAAIEVAQKEKGELRASLSQEASSIVTMVLEKLLPGKARRA